MSGKEVHDPHPAIQMFSLCDGMKWAHLPVAGGLYNQHPDLIDKFRILFSERNKEQQRQHREQQNKQNRSGGRVAGRRGR